LGFAFVSGLLELPLDGGLDRLLLLLLELFSVLPGALSLSLSLALSSLGSSGRKWPTTFVAPCDGHYEMRVYCSRFARAHAQRAYCRYRIPPGAHSACMDGGHTRVCLLRFSSLSQTEYIARQNITLSWSTSQHDRRHTMICPRGVSCHVKTRNTVQSKHSLLPRRLKLSSARRTTGHQTSPLAVSPKNTSNTK
jgi:hypothetical protein